MSMFGDFSPRLKTPITPVYPVTSVSNSDSSITVSPTTGAVIVTLNTANANTWTARQTLSLTNSHFGTGVSHMEFDNSGDVTTIDFKFGSTYEAALQVTSSGAIWAAMNNSQPFYFAQNFNGSYFSYNSPSGFYNQGYGSFGSYVYAGGYGSFGGGVYAGGSGSPSSTLQNAGSTGLQPVYITTPQTLGNDTFILADASDAVICGGSPSTGCGSYSNSTDCDANAGHGGCGWNYIEDCSVFSDSSCGGYAGTQCTAEYTDCSGFDGNYSGCVSTSGCSWDSSADCGVFGLESACNGTSGCSWTENYADCSAFNGNSGGCSGTSGCYQSSGNNCSEYYTDSSCNGNGCTAVDGDCSGFNESQCESQSGCSINMGNCSDFDYNESGCNNNSGCSWNSSSYMCSGMYFESCSGSYFEYCSGDNSQCSGSYDTGTGTCSGSYDPNTCSGSYFSYCSGSVYGCTGSASCSPLNESQCGDESGCSWQTQLNLTLPNGPVGRTYWVKKIDSSSAPVVLYPQAGQTVEGGSTITLSYQDQAVQVAFDQYPNSCSGFGYSECTSTPGCNWSDSCNSYNGNESGCSMAGCSYNGSTNVCSGDGACSGTYYTPLNWYEVSDYDPREVSGPTSSTDDAVARWDGTSGKLLQNSLFTIDDSGNAYTPGTLEVLGNVDFETKFNAYNGWTTVGNGIGIEIATVNLTAQSASISATTLIAIPTSLTGMYRVSWVATITTASDISSVLGGTNGFQIKYTDGNDSVVKTSVASVTASSNTTATTISGVLIGYCKASTNLQYSMGYTDSHTSTAMQYNLHIVVEAF